MKSLETVTVTGAAILEVGTWPLLKRALEPIIRDRKLKKLVIVGTDTEHEEQVRLFAKMYLEKIILIEENSSLGRYHLFSKLIETARNQSTDYVLFLEDTGVAEGDFIDRLLDNLKYFKEHEIGHSILIARTINIFGNETAFYSSATKKDTRDGTVFELLSISKLKQFFKHVFHIGESSLPPVFKTQSFVGGGTFVPMQALHEAKDPVATLYTYGEDTEYAWKLSEAGYSFYQCISPIIRKPSSSKPSSHAFGFFNPATSDKDVYYRMRNAVLISRRHTYQSRLVLLINVMLWLFAVVFLGIFKVKKISFFFRRFKVLIEATIDGYKDTPSFLYT